MLEKKKVEKQSNKKTLIAVCVLIIGSIVGSISTPAVMAFTFGSEGVVTRWIKVGNTVRLRNEANNVSIGANSAFFVDNTSGNVGINTSTPGSKLNVVGATNNSLASSLNVANASSTSLFFVRNDGNVGIGTNNPGALLHIVTPFARTDQTERILSFQSSNDADLRVGLKTSFIGSATAVGRTTVLESATLNVSTGTFSNFGERLALNPNGGNVGIGTINPLSKFQITAPSGDATGTGIMRFDTNSGTADTGLKIGAVAGAGNTGYSFLQGIHTNVASDGNIILNPVAGSVGIGTVIPSEKLSVVGNGLFSGTLTASTTKSASYLDLNNNTPFVQQNGGTIYHSLSWTTAGTVSTTGTTVTGSGTSFVSGMVGAKIIISNEERIIATYISTTSVAVDRAFSQNYSGQSFGIYNKSIETKSDGYVYIYPTNSNSNSKFLGGQLFTTLSSLNASFVIDPYNGMSLNKSTPFVWSGTPQYYDTKDVGLRRKATGTLEIYDGVTNGVVKDLSLANAYVNQIRSLTNGTSGIILSDTYGTPIFNIDTQNNRLGMMKGTPVYTFDLLAPSADALATRMTKGTTATNTLNPINLFVSKSTGTATDGFGSSIVFANSDNVNTGDNYLSSIGAIRSGAYNSGRLVFNTYNAGTLGEAATILPNGNFGIGTNAPGSILTVKSTLSDGTTAFDLQNGSSASVFSIAANGAWNSGTGKMGSILNIGFANNNIIATNKDGVFAWTAATTPHYPNNADTGISRGGANKVYIGNGTGGDYSGTLIAGNVGIGTISPASKLEVDAPNQTLSGSTNTAHLSLLTTDAQGADIGGALGLGGYTTTAKTLFRNFGVIAGRKENSNDGDSSGYLSFSTHLTAVGLNERMRITSGGNVGIGTTAPSEKLNVIGNGLFSGTLTASTTKSASFLDLYGNTPFAQQNGTILYHSAKWFTPSGNISSSGTTVTSVGTQFTNSMVDAKLIINGEERTITGYTSTSVVTVNSAYSQNYSGIAPASWGVYSQALIARSSGYFSTLAAKGATGFQLDPNGNVNMSTIYGAGLFSFSNKMVGWSDSTYLYSNIDTGISRNATNTLEINTGTAGTFADLKLRNLYASGNVGIGATAPAAKLSLVGGNFDIDNTNFANQFGVITKNGTRFIHDFNYGNNGTTTTVGYNTFLGVNSGNLTMGSTATVNTQASFNTGVGNGALTTNTIGYLNTAFGRDALKLNTTGYQNSAQGGMALGANTTGNNNNAMGVYAMTGNTTGSNNTAQGAQSMWSNTIGSGNTVQGYNALFSNVAGSNGVAIGFQSQFYANSTTTAWTNTNTSVGYQALFGGADASLNTGTGNSAFGYWALENNTTGYQNSSFGYASLITNTTGNFNSAQGNYALQLNTTGSSNSAFGVNALLNNTTGSANSAFGYTAGRYIADGSTGNTIGANSVFLGYGTRALADGQSNQIVIGYGAIGIGSNSVALGNDSVLTTALKGSVGIGTTNPGQKLDVFGDVQFGLGNTTASTLYLNNSTGSAPNTSYLIIKPSSGNNSAQLTVRPNGTGGVPAIMVQDSPTGANGAHNFFVGTGDNTVPGNAWNFSSTINGIANVDSWPIGFNVSNVSNGRFTAMTILPSGNVGIGTTNPAAILNVVGGNLWVGKNSASGSYDDTLFSVSGSDATPQKAMMAVRRNNAPGTLNTTGYLASFQRINSAIPAWYMGVDTSNNAILAANSSDIRIGKDISGDFTEYMRILNSNGNVGIGTTNPTLKFLVSGNGNDTSSGGIGIYNTSTGSAAAAQIYAQNNNGIYNQQVVWGSGSAGTRYGLTKASLAEITSNSPNFSIGTIGAYPLSFITNSVVGMTMLSGGNVGIGTTIPLKALDIFGSSRVTGKTNTTLAGTGSSTAGSNILTGSGTSFTTDFVVGDGVIFNGDVRTVMAIASDTSLTVDMGFSGTVSGLSVYRRPSIFTLRNNSNVEKLVVSNTGSIGMGAVNPTTVLDVRGPNLPIGTPFYGAAKAQLFIGTTDALGADIGGSIALGGLYDSNSAYPMAFATIHGKKETAGSGSEGGYLAFEVSNNSISPYNFERMRINSIGNIGIGTSTPAAKLHIVGATNDNSASSLNITNASSTSLFLVRNDGNIGVSNTYPSAKLDILSVDSTATYSAIYGRSFSGNINAVGITGVAESYRTASPFAGTVKGIISEATVNSTNSQNWTNTLGLISNQADIFVNGGATGVFTGGASYYASVNIGGGTLTNWYGMYVKNPTGSGIITNKYAFVSEENAGSVGVGTTVPTDKLEVNGGIRLNTVTTKPNCDSTHRGTLWMTQGDAGVKDILEVCAKDATDAYSWRTLY